jgi:hypothetical protein
VIATTDPDDVLALDADCVLHMAQGEMNPAGAIDDICALLASGKNVVSTALTALIYPRSAGDEVVERLEAACAAGATSFHGTGIEPGWAAPQPASPDEGQSRPGSAASQGIVPEAQWVSSSSWSLLARWRGGVANVS